MSQVIAGYLDKMTFIGPCNANNSMILWNVLLFSRCISGSSSSVGFFICGSQFPQLIRNTPSVADSASQEKLAFTKPELLECFCFPPCNVTLCQSSLHARWCELLGKASVTRPWCCNSTAYSHSFLSSNSALSYSAQWLPISAEVTINRRLLEWLCWSDQESCLHSGCSQC